MESEEVLAKGLSLFISTWNWCLIGMMFLCTSFILVGVEKYTIAIGTFGVFIIAMFFAFIKKNQLENMEE